MQNIKKVFLFFIASLSIHLLIFISLNINNTNSHSVNIKILSNQAMTINHQESKNKELNKTKKSESKITELISSSAQNQNDHQKNNQLEPTAHFESDLLPQGDTKTTINIAYPKISRILKEEGSVRIFIDKNKTCSIIKSSGFLRLDQTALKSLQELALANKVESDQSVEVKFKLHED